MKLGRATIATLSLPAGKLEQIHFDSDIAGFGLRLRRGGPSAARWIFQYDFAGRTRRITLGRVSAIDPAKARELASELRARVRLGENPAASKAESRARADETFAAALKPYLAWQRGRLRVSTLRDLERHLVKNLAPLHPLPLAQIDRRTIAQQLARLSGRGALVQTNRTRASLSKFLNWACAEGLCENNPALLTNKNPERRRERRLNKSEIRAVWNALPQNDFGDILKLLLLTAQRKREISDLQWPEIDFERGVIELPPARTKNHRRHTIPMSGMVRAILEARPRNGRHFVFGRGKSGFSGWSRSKERLELKIPAWTIHDLRRSADTGMNEIGVPPWIVEAILNHVSGHKGGVAGRYNWASYETEKTTALARWAEHVAAIVEGRESNVTPLGRRDNG